MRSGRITRSELVRTVVMFAVLYGYWLLLSGHFVPWLLISGAVISAMVAFWSLRLGLSDSEGHPVHMVLRAIVYWPWLVVEIIKAAIDVSWRIVHPALPISPDLRRYKATQKTSEGLTTYANSITLTPGTISVLVDWRRHEIVVHGLSRDGLDGLATGDMDARVTRFEGGA